MDTMTQVDSIIPSFQSNIYIRLSILIKTLATQIRATTLILRLLVKTSKIEKEMEMVKHIPLIAFVTKDLERAIQAHVLPEEWKHFNPSYFLILCTCSSKSLNISSVSIPS